MFLLFFVLMLQRGPAGTPRSTPTTLASAKITAIQTVATNSVITDLKLSVQVTTADGRVAKGDRSCGKRVGPHDVWICGDSPAILAGNPTKLKAAVARLANQVFSSNFVKDTSGDVVVVVGGGGNTIPTPTTTGVIDPATVAPNATLSAADIDALLP